MPLPKPLRLNQENGNQAIADMCLQAYILLPWGYAKGIASNFTIINTDACKKQIINRWLNNNSLARLSKRFNGHKKSRYYSRCQKNPFFINFPVVTIFHPCCQCLKIFGRRYGVTQNCLIQMRFYRGVSLMQGFPRLIIFASNRCARW